MGEIRRSKFKRTRIKANVTLKERDCEILQWLRRYRFLTSRHLQVLTDSPSIGALNRRLRALFDAQYLDRPKAQMHSLAYAEERPMVYALGNQGAALLRNRFQVQLFAGDWTDKNRAVKERFVEHTLGIADFMVALETECRDSEHLRLIRDDEVLAASPASTKLQRQPFGWLTRVRWNHETHEVSVIPDAIFGIEDANRPKGRNRAYFFVEVDRGTMPILRKDVRQTSFVRKMHSYVGCCSNLTR